ncbi:MAG: creatininase family protein [Gammaproteobacteria bacterium]
MNRNNSILVETSPWNVIQQAISDNLICVLPIGAVCKEHGLHLPLNTDYVQANWLAHQLALRFPLIVWPVISFAYYPAFTDYPGSWSISENTFIQCVTDILDSVGKHGENQLIFINTGISTIRPLEVAISQSPYEQRTTLINVYSGSHVNTVTNEIEEQKRGGHADELETSIMLAIDESLVSMQFAQAGLVDIKKGPLNLNYPNKPNYSPTGAMGNPALATKDKGKKILDAILKDLKEVIEPIANANSHLKSR